MRNGRAALRRQRDDRAERGETFGKAVVEQRPRAPLPQAGDDVRAAHAHLDEHAPQRPAAKPHPDRTAERQEPAAVADLEVIFATGERLRIRSGVDGATLRTVLRALRA